MLVKTEAPSFQKKGIKHFSMSNIDRFEKKYGAFPSLGYKLKKIFHVLFPLAWSPKRKKQTSFQGQKEKTVVQVVF